jgi:hypothetical protein
MSPDYEHWARNADDWIAWARTPDHDAFWAYRAQLLDFIGTGKGNALEVGCGEGRVSRAIKECGYRVTAARSRRSIRGRSTRGEVGRRLPDSPGNEPAV